MYAIDMGWSGVGVRVGVGVSVGSGVQLGVGVSVVCGVAVRVGEGGRVTVLVSAGVGVTLGGGEPSAPLHPDSAMTAKVSNERMIRGEKRPGLLLVGRDKAVSFIE
jgi:hypothetical protein